MNFDLCILPELILLFMVFCVLGTKIFRSISPYHQNHEESAEPYFPQWFCISWATLVLAVLAFLWAYSSQHSKKIETEIFALDHLTFLGKSLVFLLSAPWLGLGARGVRSLLRREGVHLFEYSACLLLSLIGSFLIISAVQLCLLLVGFCLQTFPLFMAQAFCEAKGRELRYPLKNFILENMASCVFLIGTCFLYIASGDLTFHKIGQYAQQNMASSHMQISSFLGFFLIILVFLYRLSAFPFHLEIKNRYQESSNLMVPFMASASLAIFISLFRFLFKCGNLCGDFWKPFLLCVGLASSFWGALSALFQTNVRSFFSCAHIFHLGVCFLGLSSGLIAGGDGAMIYWALFTAGTVTFFFFWSHLNLGDQMLDTASQAKDIGVRHPLFTSCVAFVLLSLANFPPFAGFWAQLYILNNLSALNWWCICCFLLLTVISSLQYFRIIRCFYTTDRSFQDISLGPEWKTVWMLVPVFLTFFLFFQDAIRSVMERVMADL